MDVGWFVVAAVGMFVLSLMPMLARDEWRSVGTERPALTRRAANLRRAWVALLYAGAGLWLSAVLWLLWVARLAPLVSR